MKYERAMADLDFAKRRLLEQHEEDLEQTMVLKKQLEKKVRTIRIIIHHYWWILWLDGYGLWSVKQENPNHLDTEQLSKDDFSKDQQ